MSEALISIAMCTYNGEKYLKEQLDSIINQSYQNLEIVIVDDCSADDTYAIIKQYAEADKRLKIFRNEVNLGFNKNFEKALNLTTGQYIAISDQDDVWELDKIQALADNIGDNWMIFSNSAYMDEKGGLIKGSLLNGFNFLARTYHGILLQNFVTGHTCLLNRDFLAHMLPFPANGYYDWWMGFVALYNHKLTYLEKSLTRYRIHTDSVIQLDMNHEKAKHIHFNTRSVMLQSFANYNKLNQQDAEFIEKLKNAYQQKEKSAFPITLIKIINRYYNELFPDMKQRTGLSRLNYARKYANKI